MKILLGILVVLITFSTSVAQNYSEEIRKYRENYIAELLKEKRHPIASTDTKYLQFFEPSQNYCVVANLLRTPGSKPFMMETHSGKNKPFKEYGTLNFTINDTPLLLHLYQSIDMMNPSNEYLFLPFNDYTNYETTFSGGRYLDLTIDDIKEDKILLDFNKCHNPYCAYAEGFSCPIPPTENRLHIEIKSGEKMFKKFMGN